MPNVSRATILWSVCCLSAIVGGVVCVILLRMHGLLSPVGRLGSCGGISGVECSSVLRSGYSHVFGLPAALVGVVYNIMLIALATANYGRESRLLRTLTMCFIVSGLSGSAWFVWLMATKVGFCWLCMTVHIANLGAGIAWFAWDHPRMSHSAVGLGSGYRTMNNALASAVAILATLGMLSVFHDPDSTYRSQGRVDFDPSKTPVTPAAHPAHESSPSTDGDSAVFIKPFEQRPMYLGGAEASREIELFMDLTCEKCVRLAKLLRRLEEDRPGELCVRVRLFPLDVDCNIAATGSPQVHEGACKVAYLARHVANHDPLKFAEFHELATTNGTASTESATSAAIAVLGSQDLGLETERVRNQINSDIDRAIDLGIEVVPTLIVNGKKYEGVPENDATLREILEPLLDNHY